MNRSAVLMTWMAFAACARPDPAEQLWCQCSIVSVDAEVLERFLEAEADLWRQAEVALGRETAAPVNDMHALTVGLSGHLVEGKRVAIRQGFVRRLVGVPPPATRMMVGVNCCLLFSNVADLGCLVYRIERALSQDAFDAIAVLLDASIKSSGRGGS